MADSDSKTPENDQLDTKTLEEEKPKEDEGKSETVSKEEDEEEGDEEEAGECGFCLFMKGGGCKETFTAWEQCVEEAEKTKEDVVEKCFQATSALKKCMEAHPDYYEPILRAEKAAEEEVAKELEKEKAASESSEDQNAIAAPSENSKQPSEQLGDSSGKRDG